MRYILLKSDDLSMFHQDIDQFGYEFYYRHRDAFRRMYNEQGKDFWVRYMLSFRSAQTSDILHIFKGRIKRLSDYIDSFFINAHEEFIDGPFSRAKQFFEDIVKVVEDQGYVSILQSASVVRNPFHKKDTKDIYKRFFGSPIEKSSYTKVFLLLPLYRRLAGSLCVCLRRWLDASELTDLTDNSYWVPPPPLAADKVKELTQIEALKLQELKGELEKYKDDIVKLKVAEIESAAGSVISKVVHRTSKEKRKKMSKGTDNNVNFAAESRLLTSELIQLLSSLYELCDTYLGLNVNIPDREQLNGKLPRKLEEGQQRNIQPICCADEPCLKVTSEAQGRLTTSSSISGAVESDRSRSEMTQCLQDVIECDDFDSLGIRVKRGSIVEGESKTEVHHASGAKRDPDMKQTGIIQNGEIAESKSHETREPIKKTSKTSNRENSVKETSVKQTSVKGTSAKETSAKETSVMETSVKGTSAKETCVKETSAKETSAKTKSKATDSKARKEQGGKKEATEESDSKEEFKVTEDDSKKDYQATKDESDVKVGREEEKEPSRPGSNNARTCMNCGLQEPAPKVFKKCKRCKDEGCLDPPYYCGRNCQVLDWTARHRQEHETSDP